MKFTITLDDQLGKTVSKIVVERDIKLTGLVRAYLEQLAAESGAEATK